jgi:hypothetical protein
LKSVRSRLHGGQMTTHMWQEPVVVERADSVGVVRP